MKLNDSDDQNKLCVVEKSGFDNRNNSRDPAKIIIMEMDGLMVPTVTNEDSPDRRKSKTVQFHEMKIGLIQLPGEISKLFAHSFMGSDLLGDRLGSIVKRLGGNEDTTIHGLGDGALWIPEQGERIAAQKYQHTIDFYHLCEYLSKAFEGGANKELKMHRSKHEMLIGEVTKVRRRLHRQASEEGANTESIAECLKYINNRPGQFEYHKAIKQDLPIGSGGIESTNRFLIQRRLKLSGSWWKRENAEKMAALRVVRANGQWNELWRTAA